MQVGGLHPILHVDDPHAERDFYALFGFTTSYEGPEFPNLLALTAGDATFGVSRQPGETPVPAGFRWQFTVDDVDAVLAVCREHDLPHELEVETGGDRFRTRIVKVTSPARMVVWFEGPNEATGGA